MHGFKWLRFFLLAAIVLLLLATGACVLDTRDDDDDSGDDDDGGFEPVTSLFSASAGATFFDAPFPVEHMRREDGTLRFGLLPNPNNNLMVQHYIDQADAETNGFSCLGPIYLPFSGPINQAGLPRDVFESLDENASVFLVNVEKSSPLYGRRVPIHLKWQARQTDYLPANLLMLLPHQGVPLEPEAHHAAVVLSSLGDETGRDLLPSDALSTMSQGKIPEGEYGAVDAAAFVRLWDYCDEIGLPRENVAAATVFKTGVFVREMKALRDHCASLPDPVPYDLELLAEYDNFYIVEGKLILPIWQEGYRIYVPTGGRIRFEDGRPVHQGDEEVRFAVSVPKTPMPDAGYPLLFYANGQGGTYTQVFDRGGIGEAAHDPGTGPGRQFAHRGVACIDIEAPLAGPRHPTGSYSGAAFFNFWNLVAFRDNIRQAASEFTMLTKMVRNLQIPTDLVPLADTDGAPVVFDTENFYFWGHSTGASIGNLVLAVEPEFRAGMVSGAGTSWGYNLALKEKPLPLASTFRLLSGAVELDEFHPLSALFQSICDPAEAAYFARHWIHEPLAQSKPTNRLIIMGVFDEYFPPPMIDGLVVASGVDLAGSVRYVPTLDALKLSGRSRISLPASGNIISSGEKVTGLVVQHRTPEGVDGHYAPFYLLEAKYQYTCFFASLAQTGQAILPAPNPDPYAPCGFEQ